MSWLDKHITWKLITVFGRSKIINRSYIYLLIVPLIAKFFSKIESPINFFLGGTKYQLDIDLPFNWLIFYFCALIFTLASIIYHITVPKIIREHDSFASFKEKGMNLAHMVEYASEVGIDDSIKFDEDFGDYRKKEIYFKYLDYRSDFKKSNKTEKGMASFFWELYKVSLTDRSLWLMITTFLYFFGFVLIFLVLKDGFDFIIDFILRDRWKVVELQ